jgi:hypothetical protein
MELDNGRQDYQPGEGSYISYRTVDGSVYFGQLRLPASWVDAGSGRTIIYPDPSYGVFGLPDPHPTAPDIRMSEPYLRMKVTPDSYKPDIALRTSAISFNAYQVFGS